MTDDRSLGSRPAADGRLARQLLARADDSGLTVRELRLLLALPDGEPLSAGAAATAAGLPPAAGYRAVEGLRGRDLIVEDRRRYRLTPGGIALAAGLRRLPDDPGPAGRVAVGVDESAAARAALRWAAAEAVARRAVLHVVHAWRQPVLGVGVGMPAGGVMAEDADRDQVAATRVLTDIVRDELGGMEPAMRGSVGRGEPARVLLEAAVGADLLVLGSGAGSVLRHLVSHAACPVVVVGPAAA